ncbi:hypothetical protein EG328_011194 [Venturia inaequalis]|uniref:DUF1776-domain-containing protein n=1 Tax=Venturia inaequalis TaxID=5025 RepID=A0A8H3Z770_VENIN|nr:hypothetical protein EG328_011194 [Venturia inaequalis]
MESKDTYLFGTIGGVSQGIQNITYSTGHFFDVVDKQIDSFASSIRSVFSSSSWLPESIKPPPPPPRYLPANQTYIRAVAEWILRHKAITAAFVAFMSTGGVLVWHQRIQKSKRRRARRTANGTRLEVIVVAGEVGSLLLRSLVADLEKRGFIVYVVVKSIEEEDSVREEAEGKVDVRPFLVDVNEPIQTQQALSRFHNLLITPHQASPGARPHQLSFAGLILAPDLVYPSGPIETLSPELWQDSINSKILLPITTAQAFLPTICEFKARVLVLTPNVVASLKPAFHGMESAIVGALDGFTTTLRRELRTLGIHVCQIKLGNFDFSHLGGARTHLQSISASRTIAWPPSARMLYAQNFINQGRIAEGKGMFGDTGSIAKASSPRELHYAIFDALTQKRPSSVWRVGRGSLAYDIVGNWVPGGLVGWVLGLRTVSLEEFGGPPAAVQQPDVVPTNMEESMTAQSWEKIERGGSPVLGA